MSLYTILTIIISVTAVFAYINFRYIKLPVTIGIMVMSLVCSVLLVTLGKFFPQLSDTVVGIVRSIDFHDLLMEIMLSFLLFAGAIHINASALRKEWVPVVTLATIGILISTFIVGGITYYLFRFLGYEVDLIYCLLFGSLISPTDPIAVMGILKKAKIPESMELKIAGESMFNDGVAVVIFITLLHIARSGTEEISAIEIGKLFAVEALGGVLFGAVIGYTGFWALRSIDNYQVEVLITLAMVMGGYALAQTLHVSGPLAMVVAGIITGNKGTKHAMSDVTRDYLGKFWELIDEILNAILFLLIGFEMLVVQVTSTLLMIGGISILVVLMARLAAVAIPVLLLRFKLKFESHAIAILTWGGLRGGISVALALSLPETMYRNEFVTITYVVVIFSIIVQGLSIGTLAKKLLKTT